MSPIFMEKWKKAKNWRILRYWCFDFRFIIFFNSLVIIKRTYFFSKHFLWIFNCDFNVKIWIQNNFHYWWKFPMCAFYRNWYYLNSKLACTLIVWYFFIQSSAILISFCFHSWIVLNYVSNKLSSLICQKNFH